MSIGSMSFSSSSVSMKYLVISMPRLQVLESPDDALQVTRGLAVLGEQRLAVLDADPRMIEVDRDLGAGGEKGPRCRLKGR